MEVAAACSREPLWQGSCMDTAVVRGPGDTASWQGRFVDIAVGGEDGEPAWRGRMIDIAVRAPTGPSACIEEIYDGTEGQIS